MVSEKWPKKNGKKSYFPKTKITKNIKKEAEVDKESGNWGLYSCRILMNGGNTAVPLHSVAIIHFICSLIAKFETYQEARDAEAIAQNHSTMTSFEASYTENQKSRKHPKVFISGSEGECDADIKNIAELTKRDAEAKATADKEYSYFLDDDRIENEATNASNEYDGNESVDGSVKNGSDCDSIESVDESMENDSECEANENESDQNYESDGDDKSNNGNEASDMENENRRRSDSDVFQFAAINNLESTSELRSPREQYDFSDDRGMVRVEKLLMHVCRELETIKSDMKALKIKSKDTESVVEKLVSVCKDLSVEVFSCTEEFKKRNGMFTDLLVPDLKLPVTRRKHYTNNETELKKHKIADNLVIYYDCSYKVT